MSLKGRVAVVTGSNSGIGLGIAEALAGVGADVVLNSFTDRPEDHALAARIAADTSVRAVYVRADMANGDDCRGLVARAAEALGRVDILVNNAGIQHVAPIPDFPPDTWDRILATNLSSVFRLTRAALPHLTKGGGHVFMVSSLAGSPLAVAVGAASSCCA